jgi:hypothetical protein
MFHDLEEKGKNWHKELPLMLGALWTNINRAIKDTLFHLVYRADAVQHESAWVAQFSEEDKNEVRELDSSLIEEKHNKALANMQKYQGSSAEEGYPHKG